MNKIILVGKVLENTGNRTTKGGVQYASIKLESVESKGTFTINGTAWNKLAEDVANIKVGNTVMVCGRLKLNSYQDNSGNTKYSFEILVESCETLVENNPTELTSVGDDFMANINTDDLPF